MLLNITAIMVLDRTVYFSHSVTGTHIEEWVAENIPEGHTIGVGLAMLFRTKEDATLCYLRFK